MVCRTACAVNDLYGAMGQGNRKWRWRGAQVGEEEGPYGGRGTEAVTTPGPQRFGAPSCFRRSGHAGMDPVRKLAPDFPSACNGSKRPRTAPDRDRTGGVRVGHGVAGDPAGVRASDPEW